jgi:hypothetical protein
MWLIDGNEDGFITHVGIYVKINDEDGVIHASADVDKVVKELFSTSAVDWRAWWAGDVQGQAGLGRIPHNYKETK